MSVHAGAERNVWIIKVSAETPQSTTDPSQTLLPMYKLAHLPLSHPKDSHNLYLSLLRRCATDASIRYRPLAQIDLKCVYITYLHVCMRQYMRFFIYRKCQVSNKPAHFLKFLESFRCSHTQSMCDQRKLWWNFKNAQAYWICGDKLACTDR